jgi:hypothetical protein
MAFERDGKLPEGVSCEDSIRYSRCPAIAMRKEEMKEGRAIYFINRIKLQTNQTDAVKSVPMFLRKSVTEPKASSSVVPERKGDVFDNLDYAAAINQVIRETKSDSCSPVKHEMSLREIALARISVKGE